MNPLRPSNFWFFLARLFRVTRVTEWRLLIQTDALGNVTTYDLRDRDAAPART
jgi:hypothetical protein